MNHCLGLKSDGSIVAWGLNGSGQCNVPRPNKDFVAIAAGHFFSLGLKSDGSIVAWGINDDHQCEVPVPNKGFVTISASSAKGLGIREDGSVAIWGHRSGPPRKIDIWRGWLRRLLRIR